MVLVAVRAAVADFLVIGGGRVVVDVVFVTVVRVAPTYKVHIKLTVHFLIWL